MTREYCTYFDHRYAARGIAMIRSLRRHAPSARVFVLCLDDQVRSLLQKLDEPGVVLVSIGEFERDDPALSAAREDGRSRMEYYFTCSPSLIRYVMHAAPDAEWVTYLDGDLWFFSPPDCIYQELADASVGIVAHRYPSGHEAKNKYGIYNVGWVSFRRTPAGLACLDWWRERCLEWCLDTVDEANDRFADQRYLNRFSVLFSGVHAIANAGVNLAPWNIAGHRLALADGHVTVDGTRLVFFHFHGLKRASRRLFLTSHGQYGAGVDRATREGIYKPYLREILEVESIVTPLMPAPASESIRMGASREGSGRARLRKLRDLARSTKAFLRGLTVWMPRPSQATDRRVSR